MKLTLPRPKNTKTLAPGTRVKIVRNHANPLAHLRLTVVSVKNPHRPTCTYTLHCDGLEPGYGNFGFYYDELEEV